jgi:hypothetical protein
MAGLEIKDIYPNAEPNSRYKNHDTQALGDAEAAVAAAWEADEQLRKFRAGNGPIRPAPQDLERQKKVALSFARMLGIEPADLPFFTPHGHSPGDKVIGAHHMPRVLPLPPPTSPDEGVLTFAEIRTWTPTTLIGLSTFIDGTGAQFVGQLEYDNGDLFWDNTGASAVFALPTDRMPPPGRYTSAPTCDLTGDIMGFCGVNGPFTFGDIWSKSWLHTDQTIRNADGDQIANAHDVKQIVFLENSGSQDLKMLPGSLFMPPVAFDLDPHQPLTVTLQWLIDIQLEGDSLFRFGSLGGLMPTILRTSNWTLQRT